MHAKLTIAIPTWNRCEFLRENVTRIIQEIEKLSPGLVDVIVLDNASTDATEDVMEALQAKYPFIRYFRHSRNFGANANFLMALAKAEGEYVWLFGDDDAIVENSLPRILEDLKNYQADVIIGGTQNEATGERVYLRKIQAHLFTDENILKVYNAINLAGKMSVLIFRRKSLQKVLGRGWNIIRRLKSPWPHLIWMLLILSQRGKLLILPYSTNYYLKKSKYNTIFDGIQRTDLVFSHYAQLVEQTSEYFSPDMQKHLKNTITAGQQGELLKMAAYSSYLNSYGETLGHAVRVLRVLPTLRNKLDFAFFYGLPIIAPRFSRLLFLQLPIRILPSWRAYRDFLSYLSYLRAHRKTFSERNFFNKMEL